MLQLELTPFYAILQRRNNAPCHCRILLAIASDCIREKSVSGCQFKSECLRRMAEVSSGFSREGLAFIRALSKSRRNHAMERRVIF